MAVRPATCGPVLRHKHQAPGHLIGRDTWAETLWSRLTPCILIGWGDMGRSECAKYWDPSLPRPPLAVDASDRLELTSSLQGCGLAFESQGSGGTKPWEIGQERERRAIRSAKSYYGSASKRLLTLTGLSWAKKAALSRDGISVSASVKWTVNKKALWDFDILGFDVVHMVFTISIQCREPEGKIDCLMNWPDCVLNCDEWYIVDGEALHVSVHTIQCSAACTGFPSKIFHWETSRSWWI